MAAEAIQVDVEQSIWNDLQERLAPVRIATGLNETSWDRGTPLNIYSNSAVLEKRIEARLESAAAI